MARAMCIAVTFLLAHAAARANGCSGGSECPSDAQPKNILSLLQTKLHMNVLVDVPSMMKNPSAMLTELDGMVRSGETPAFDLVTTIKTLILDEIMPSLKTTRDLADSATKDALRAIQMCNNDSQKRQDEIANNEQIAVENARSLHAACRDAQKNLHYHNLTDSESYCVRLGKFLHGAAPLEIAAGSSRSSSVQYVKWASTTNMCSHTEVTELDNGCTASEAELADKKAECSEAQESFQSHFCFWKGELESNCKDLDTCHSAAVTAYDNHVSKTRSLVLKWNTETAALQKILCYCNVWLSEKDDGDNRSQHNATQFDVCQDQTHMPSPVDYGTPEDKVECSLTSVANYPGTSGFFTQEYENCTDFVDTVVACPGAPTTKAPTTKAPMQFVTLNSSETSCSSAGHIDIASPSECESAAEEVLPPAMHGFPITNNATDWPSSCTFTFSDHYGGHLFWHPRTGVSKTCGTPHGCICKRAS